MAPVCLAPFGLASEGLALVRNQPYVDNLRNLIIAGMSVSGDWLWSIFRLRMYYPDSSLTTR